MENLKITKTKITWEINKEKFNSKIKHETTVLNHGDHISVFEVSSVNGDIKNQDLIHIPIELIDKIKDLKKF